MIPEPSQTLADLAQRIATHILPELSSEFAQADAGMILSMLLTLSQDYERAIDARMQDISEMRDLFATLPEQYPDTRRCQDYIDQAPSSLHLPDVNALHGEGLRLLIDVHAWAERHDDSTNAAVWALLRRHSERHKFDLAMP